MTSSSIEKGLSIHSRSLLVFRLTEPLPQADGRGGHRQPPAADAAMCVLVINGDDEELFRQTISGKDPPVPLDLNIEGVRRLEILVDFGETLDVADHLNLCNARIVK